jgi:hypothetical protein
VHLGGSHHVVKWLGNIGPDARSWVAKMEFMVIKARYMNISNLDGGEGRGIGAMDLLATCARLKDVRVTFAENVLVEAYWKKQQRHVGLEKAKKEWRRGERERVKALGWLGARLPGLEGLMGLRGLEVLEVRLWPRCVGVRDQDRREVKRALGGCMEGGAEGGLTVYSERGGGLWEIDDLAVGEGMVEGSGGLLLLG